MAFDADVDSWSIKNKFLLQSSEKLASGGHYLRHLVNKGLR